MDWKQTINKWQFIISVFSFILLFVSLYQLEIVTINALNNSCFEFPFFIIRASDFGLDCMTWNWYIRDFWYATIILAFFLLLYAIWRWE
jgi:hypothetical protein